MRSLDSEGLWWRDAKASCSKMLTLPFRLWICHLQPFYHVYRIQVWISTWNLVNIYVRVEKNHWLLLNNSKSYFQIFSSCDSRNLNLSPFCNLSSTSLAMWQPSILETYGNQTTAYVKHVSGPLRSKYPDSMDEDELITSLVKVIQLVWNPEIR